MPIPKVLGKKNLKKVFGKDFTNGEKAFKQALLWAYFRIPFFAALLTGLLIIYVIFGGTVPIYQVVAGLAAILLWIQPNLSQGYKDEANPEDYGKENEEEFAKNKDRIFWKIPFPARPLCASCRWNGRVATGSFDAKS